MPTAVEYPRTQRLHRISAGETVPRLVFVALDPNRLASRWQRVMARLLKWPALAGVIIAPIVALPVAGQIVGVVAALLGQHSSAWALVTSLVLTGAMLAYVVWGAWRWSKLGVVPIEGIAFGVGLLLSLGLEIARVAPVRGGP